MNRSMALLLAALCIGSTGCGDRTKTETFTRPPAEPAQPAPPSPPPSVPGGIGISRDSLINAFQRAPLSFAFQRQEHPDGQEAYFGLSQTIPGGTIELVGPPENLTNANGLIIVGGTNKDDTRAAIALANLANLIDKSSTEWLNSQIQLVAKDPQSSRKDEKVMGERLYRFNYIYLEQGGTMSLTVLPAVQTTQSRRRR